MRKKRSARKMRKKRSARKIILSSALICFVVFALSFVIGSNIGFANGRTEGYDTGYTEGHDNGFRLGHSEGYISGYENGYDNGYDNGLDIGRTHGYNIMDPTYWEMRHFIDQDKTNENEYIENVYTCFEYTADVCRNADAENIRCAFVRVEFVEGAHSLVAFNTIDIGLLFIESQSDKEMNLVIGEPYWPRDEYLPPDYDDTVVGFTIIW